MEMASLVKFSAKLERLYLPFRFVHIPNHFVEAARAIPVTELHINPFGNIDLDRFPCLRILGLAVRTSNLLAVRADRKEALQGLLNFAEQPGLNRDPDEYKNSSEEEYGADEGVAKNSTAGSDCQQDGEVAQKKEQHEAAMRGEIKAKRFSLSFGNIRQRIRHVVHSKNADEHDDGSDKDPRAIDRRSHTHDAPSQGNACEHA
mgnify:CR=1 FL=1